MSEGVAARRLASLFTIYGRSRKNNSWYALVYRRRRQQASERANFAAVIIVALVAVISRGSVRHAGARRDD